MDIDPRLSDAESGAGDTAGRATAAPISPLDFPSDCRGVTLFGGTFDPPHRWHMRGAMAVARIFEATLVVVPAARNPLKATGPVASDEDRVAMVKLALEALSAEEDAEYRYGLRVWTDEIDRAKWARERGTTTPSYTIDTMRRLREIVGSGVRVWFIIGVDQALAFHTWREYRELFHLASPLTMPRDGVTECGEFEKLLRATGAWDEDEIDEWKHGFGQGIPLEPVSSTHIREALKRGEPTPDLDPAVRAYIDERGLYR